MTSKLVALVSTALLAASCKTPPKTDRAGAPDAAAPASSAFAVQARALKAPLLSGGVLMRSAAGDALLLADEDHGAVRLFPLSPSEPRAQDAGAEGDAGTAPAGRLGPLSKMVSFTVPGPPAQVLPLGDGRVLVTLRDPGMLFILKPDPSAGLVEAGRVALPRDAWGVAITPDEKTALVSSAWTHQVSAVDLATLTKRWTIDVAREPRGIVVRADGQAAYVTHLVGSDLTRIDGLAGTPTAHMVALPPGPERAPSGKTLHASLGYSAALSDDGGRLYVARHALGALGGSEWFGAATVDVLVTATDTPAMVKHAGGLPASSVLADDDLRGPKAGGQFLQPRATLYRKSTRTLLVAGEGTDNVAELDALSPAPSMQLVRDYNVGADYKYQAWVDHYGAYGGGVGADGIAERGAGPAGMALDEDEDTLYVYCAGSHDLVSVPLARPPARAKERSQPMLRVAEDPLSKDAAIGRRFFLNAIDQTISGGLGCAGCHPEGRDDGMVWRQAKPEPDKNQIRGFGGEPENLEAKGPTAGYPRQTPMLAGRIGLKGPFGWHGQSPQLGDRLKEGFNLHRWGRMDEGDYGGEINLAVRVRYLSAFVREGLVPPPREERALSAEEEQGQKLFNGAAVGCARCHVPGSGYTDVTVYPMPAEPRPTFDKEENQDFKTPSLRFVGGTPPYFHDGRAGSLEELVAKNNDRMGHTNQLSNEERAALVAFLKTL